MPISLASYIQPRNATNPDPALRNTYYLLEDVYLKGGYQVWADVAARDAINPLNLKAGMLVYTLAENKMWQYGADSKWAESKLGGGGGGAGTRSVSTHTSSTIASAGFEDFDIEMGSTCALLLQLSVDVPCGIEIHSTPIRADTNPYKFIGTADHLSDDGSTIMSDGSTVMGRRFSILANIEVPSQTKAYARIINLSTSEIGPVTVQLDILPQ